MRMRLPSSSQSELFPSYPSPVSVPLVHLFVRNHAEVEQLYVRTSIRRHRSGDVDLLEFSTWCFRSKIGLGREWSVFPESNDGTSKKETTTAAASCGDHEATEGLSTYEGGSPTVLAIDKVETSRSTSSAEVATKVLSTTAQGTRCDAGHAGSDQSLVDSISEKLSVLMASEPAEAARSSHSVSSNSMWPRAALRADYSCIHMLFGGVQAGSFVGKFACANPKWKCTMAQAMQYSLAVMDEPADTWDVSLEPPNEPFVLEINENGTCRFAAWFRIHQSWSGVAGQQVAVDEYDLLETGTWRQGWDPFGLFGTSVVFDWEGVPMGEAMTFHPRGEGPCSPTSPIQPPDIVKVSPESDGSITLKSEHGWYAIMR
jgi:hypothetical protein